LIFQFFLPICSSLDQTNDERLVEMLQPRNLLCFRHCLSSLKVSSSLNKRTFSLSRRVLQDSTHPILFTPASSGTTKPTFKQSPISPSSTQDTTVLESSYAITYHNFDTFEGASLVKTGPLSGRSIACRPGRVDMALSKLIRIARDNNIWEESRKHARRYKPSTARRMLRSKRHRIRFKQGVGRLAQIVLKMRKKSY
jgi:hypothetical protein